GVHLGQNDGDAISARLLLGQDKIIGVTVNTFEELEQANQLPIDYIGLGAVFPTQTKVNVRTIWGIDNLAKACQLAKHPIVAIGGIDETNGQSVIQAGVTGIAAVGAIHNSSSPAKTIQTLLSYTAQDEQS